jgi:alcohol dehydrogenase, propanol-preferring
LANRKQAGAKRVVSNIEELKDECLSLIVDFAGVGTTTAGALEAVGPGGRVVLVGRLAWKW